MIGGIGSAQAKLVFWVPHVPPLRTLQNLVSVRPLLQIEQSKLIDVGGNHWRKIINCMAKIAHELMPGRFPTWQLLRDQPLLGDGGEVALVALPKPSAPLIRSVFDSFNCASIHFCCGKQLTEQCFAASDIIQVDQDFAKIKLNSAWSIPYLDYRQLSNAKITRLVNLVKSEEY
ncbi:MAG: hypothetical protein HWE13_11595 [Gammaproteobacteria bacterium]|nr:hypothetical protein [Gammaproteobacteria bacterium]NVK88766.1 hypothetical protein [Gammaproteobacteria bacterium]